MRTVCAGGTTVKGIDIYDGNLISDVTKLKPGGIQYAMLKAYEHSEDPKFQSRWESMLENGIIRGAYDYFHPESDPIAQAKSLFAIVGKLQIGDLPVFLDCETLGDIASDRARNRIFSAISELSQLFGKVPGIYIGPYFAQQLALNANFAACPLWISHYGVKCPLIPSPWTSWNFWQTTGGSAVEGIAGKCDTDLFNGSLDQLKALCVQ